ncbi:hypothetical protein [Pseudomonas syringae]|uniref:hypothetical protein n=1 Tax=Pseudomonas syringae TaxID=317 RepID=UPI000362AFD6|nr:hypothetical protein [Pseudomonas syringae]MDU8540427.1 hypothetical protein [Pseudomonas syringae pv. actinidiae]
MIPVVDFTATTSFAKDHPAIAVVTVLVLLFVLYGFSWFVKKFPQHKGKLLLACFAAYLAGAVWINWEMFKTEPSIASQLEAATQQYQNVMDNGIEVAIINVNRNPGPGDRITFMDVQGQQCSYFGVVKPERYVAITRRQCPGELQKLVTMYVPLDKGPLGTSGQRRFMAYPIADTKSTEAK